MSPDPKRFSRLLFYVSSAFIGVYLIASLWRLFQAHRHPGSVSPDDVLPAVDLIVIATVILAYGVFLLIRYLRGREERDFRRYYNQRKQDRRGA